MNEYKKNEAFIDKYQAAIQLYEKAEKRLAEGDADDTLTAARKSLEFFVKDFCRNCGLPLEDDSGLPIKSEDLINSLKDAGLFEEQELTLLHAIRKLGNVGSHELASLDKAQEAVQLLGKAVDMFAARDNEDAFAQQTIRNNVPMKNSNYYDPKRKYMGEWAFCYSREDLFSIPEYVELHRNAEQGDVSAMLDLAIGFLPRKERVWGKDQLVCMPKYRSYYNDEDDAIDARYYYWIVRACDRAVKCFRSGLEYPKKYMATALFEALKFVLRWNLFPVGHYVSAVHGSQFAYDDQFRLVYDIYGDNYFYEYMFADEWAILLMQLVQEYGFEIIDPLHAGHRAPENIRFMVACINYSHGCEIPDDTCRFFEFRDCVMTLDQLKAIKPANGSCDEYYNACLQQEAAQQAEKDRLARLAAEQQAREAAAREAAEREAAAQKAKEEAALAQEAERKAKAEAKKARKIRRRRILAVLLLAVAACSVYAKKTGYEVDWSALVPDALEERFQVETVNPFEDLEIRVSGAAPDVRVELWNNSLHSFMQEVTFSASHTDGLGEGDRIKIVANYDKWQALKAGYRLEPTTMTYTVDQVDHYTRSCEEIEANVWDAMYTQASDMVEAYIASASATALLNDLDATCGYVYSYSRTQGIPELDRVFFLNRKPGFSEDACNMCHLILRVPLTLTYNDSPKEVHFDGYAYFTVTFTNLLDEPDGTTVVTLSNGTLNPPRNHTDKIYDQTIRTCKAEYTVEEVLADALPLSAS